jgi:hypothetical protein
MLIVITAAQIVLSRVPPFGDNLMKGQHRVLYIRAEPKFVKV